MRAQRVGLPLGLLTQRHNRSTVIFWGVLVLLFGICSWPTYIGLCYDARFIAARDMILVGTVLLRNGRGKAGRVLKVVFSSGPLWMYY